MDDAPAGSPRENVAGSAAASGALQLSRRLLSSSSHAGPRDRFGDNSQPLPFHEMKDRNVVIAVARAR
jgi:hypothetical protein